MANSYGFLVHPYLTLKKISRDRSQMAIFVALWFGGWMGVLLIVGLGFLIARLFPQFSLLKRIFLMVAIFGGVFLFVFTAYLIYWIRIFKTKK